MDYYTEQQNFLAQNPLNAANSINFNDRAIAIDSFTNFNKISISSDFVQWSEFLNLYRRFTCWNLYLNWLSRA
jgi:hypothetical protein